MGDWENGYQPLWDVSFFAVLFYVLYILFASFCVMNVIIGIFCHNAQEAFDQDRENVLEHQHNSKKRYVEALVELFHHLDIDASNKISAEEFELALEDNRMTHILASLDIERRDAIAIFEVLDNDGSGDIGMEEFITGCISFRGKAKAVQVEKVHVATQGLANHMRDVTAVLDQVHQLCLNLTPTLASRKQPK